jgi:hypothetical protein
LVRTPEGKNHLRDLGLDGIITLKLILTNQPQDLDQ